jgi:hypothetical protein
MHRATGVIYTSDVPEQRVVLQVVGRRVDFSTQGGWDQRVPRTHPDRGHRRSRQHRYALMYETFSACISASSTAMPIPG